MFPLALPTGCTHKAAASLTLVDAEDEGELSVADGAGICFVAFIECFSNEHNR